MHKRSQHEASDSVNANFSAFSNPADAQNVFCMGLCGEDVCPKNYVNLSKNVLEFSNDLHSKFCKTVLISFFTQRFLEIHFKAFVIYIYNEFH